MPYSIKYNPHTISDNPHVASLKKEIFEKIHELFNHQFKKRKIIPGVDMIETSGKDVGVEELTNATDAVLDGWWTEGKYAEQFNKLLREYLGIKLCLLTNSGSSANLIALSSLTSPLLGVRRLVHGDEIIGVAAAFPTTVNPIIQIGCVPVFVDIELNTLNIDWKMLPKALTPRTKAIMVAHTQGNPFRLDKIVSFAKKHKLWIIEDCCDALGAEYKGRKVGTYGDVATFSFYPAHQITLGEGGAVVTNNPWIYKAARSFRDWGRDCWCETGEDNKCRRRFSWNFPKLPEGYDHKFVYKHIGYNLKLTDIQAAIGVAQIKKISLFVSKRRKNFKYLMQKLKKYKKYFIFQEEIRSARASWFGFMITLTPKCTFIMQEIVTFLNEKKVATRPLYCGNITYHPSFENVTFRQIGNLKNTDYSMNHTFWVGVHPNLTNEQMNYITSCFGEFIQFST